MTATGLAAAAGVSKSFISQIESGRTSASLATLERIASALGVHTGVLLSSAPDWPDPADEGDQARLLHSRDVLRATSGVRLLTDVHVAAHAVVTLPPGGAAQGNSEARGGFLLTGLRGSVTVRTAADTLTIAAGDVAGIEPVGDFDLTNEGPGPALVLFSVPSTQDLPQVGRTTRASSNSVAYDTTGPLRLVSMRARRAAEKVR